MPNAYVNVDFKLSYDQTLTIEEFTNKVAALLANGTIRDAFDAAGLTLEDFTLTYAENEE